MTWTFGSSSSALPPDDGEVLDEVDLVALEREHHRRLVRVQLDVEPVG